MVKKYNNYFIDNFKSIYKLNENWDNILNYCVEYFIKYNYSRYIINFISNLRSNKIICVIIFFFSSYYLSKLLLNIIFYFMLIDSLIISLLVIQNNSVNTNSRRLAKNIILISFISFNLIGGIITLLIMVFMYMEYSKFINRLTFKLIKFLIKLTSNFFPAINILYPDIKLFNFDDPDMTITSLKIKKKKKI